MSEGDRREFIQHLRDHLQQNRPVFGEATLRNRGRLPHLEVEDGLYAVTFRQHDSVPSHILESYRSERESIIENATQQERDLTNSEMIRLAELFSERIEDYLDRGRGSCVMGQPAAAEIVRNCLQHFDGERYRLYAWAIMPNHVHVLFQALRGTGLDSILHSWKSFSAQKINRVLHRKGPLWQREYYDHLVRDVDDFFHAVEYVESNPVKVGFQDWPWVWSFRKEWSDADPQE